MMNNDAAQLHAIIDAVRQLRAASVAARTVLTLIPDDSERDLEQYLMNYCDRNETLQLKLMIHGRYLFARLMKEQDTNDNATS